MTPLSFRAKLIAIVGTAALAFVVVIIASTVTSRSTARQLTEIQQRFLPKVELAPQLEGQFERLRRALQDAVAAHDIEAVAETRALEEGLLDELAAAHEVVEPVAASRLREAIQDYYGVAVDVARRLIGGETGEGLVAAMGAMQGKQTRALERLKLATTFDRAALKESFAAAARAQATGGSLRFATSVACLALVILLSFWLGRGVLRSLGALTEGLRRFGGGDFSRPIMIVSRDELGDVARQANQMAENLQLMSEQRDRTSWLKNVEAGLAQELRGELEPTEVAGRAVRFLSRAVDARVGALYYADPGPSLRLLGEFAVTRPPAGAAPSFNPGEGLVGQAALQSDLMIVRDPPADYLRVRSGLGEGPPRALVLLPLLHVGRAAGVLELALFSPWTEQYSEALHAIRETLVIAIEVARARAAMRDLLSETQRQAQRLSEQEDELRSTNEELQAQQEELRQSNRELTEQAEELEAQRRRLEENNADLDEARRTLEQKAAELTTVSAYKSQFLANMSHELRTPLNSMLLLSNLLGENQGKNLTDKQIEFANTIHAAGKDLLVLINQVLDLAKIEAGKHEVRVGAVPLRELAEHAERIFAPLAREKGLRLVVEVGPALPESIDTDRQRVEQILNNLLGNAIKFTAEGEVALRIGRPDPQARFGREDLRPGSAVALSVTDTGVGIAPEHQERIFSPFEQVDAASDRRYGGTGLGLTISRELATLLGGELQLRSALGRGSTFVCVLPFALPAVAAGERPTAPGGPPGARPAAASAQPGPGGSALLVIEDDHRFAGALVEIIGAQGLECLVAPDGESGLRLARERRPAGIILDVKLPDVDGWRIMEQLRADAITAAIPVHFVSAVDASDRGLALGAIGYLTKPADRQDLVRMVESLAPKTAARTPRVLVVEDDALTGDSLVRMLGGEDLEVRRVMTAGAALEALRAERYGCLILDLSLPDMDGLALLQRLREQHAGDMPSIVVYTARALSKAEAETLEAYTEAVVLKEGSSTERLLEEVRLFARRLKDGLGPRRQMAPRLHPAGVQLEGKKILVVDDDMRTVYALSATLRAKGAEVLVADTGHAALGVLDQRPDVQAVLMDIMMPEMDGYEAMRRIRQDARFRALPIIALTAKAMKGDQARCVEAGASDYLPKPIDPDGLLAMLHARLSPGGAHGS